MLVSPAFFKAYVKLPPNTIPPEILDNPHYYPFFRGCHGAVDGSLLDGFVPMADMSRYRSRKGRISQNLFAACKFNLQFCYLLSGWEGSAADGRVFEDARRKGFAIPEGCFYLGDAGFPVCDHMLVPYRGVRYHLNEWRKAGNTRYAQ
jgi:DDE superfamily endonuclease